MISGVRWSGIACNGAGFYNPRERTQLQKGKGMKQKYTIHKDIDNKRLIIKEYAELDKEILSLLCEESYDDAWVMSAIQNGTAALIKALRTRNMYPPSAFVSKIAAAVVSLYTTGDEQSIEIMFDDKELFEKEARVEEPETAINTDAEDIDDILEDEIDDVYEDKNMIKDLKSSLKVADDESVHTDDDV
jgi:hypothetical protein